MFNAVIPAEGAIMTDKYKRALEIVYSGDLYNSGDPDILQVQHRCLSYMEEYNQTRTSDGDYAAREALLRKMFASVMTVGSKSAAML